MSSNISILSSFANCASELLSSGYSSKVSSSIGSISEIILSASSGLTFVIYEYTGLPVSS